MAARARSRFDRDDDTGPRSDVYTGLLALSLIAMIVSSLLLFLDYSQYAGPVPKVSVPAPKVREGVQTGQLPPMLLPPPAPIGERPFTRGTDTAAAQPVKPAGGEEAQAPVAPAPAPVVVAPPPMPVADPPPAPIPPPAPAPEPVATPPTPAPAPPAHGPGAPAPPPLPKSIRNLPN